MPEKARRIPWKIVMLAVAGMVALAALTLLPVAEWADVSAWLRECCSRCTWDGRDATRWERTAAR